MGAAGAAGLWFDRLFSYGFAHGVMTSRVAQFGGVPGVALAAGGRVLARPRAGPSHCARVAWAAGGRVWWAPEVKDRASSGPLQRGVGRGVLLPGGGPGLVGSACARGCAALSGGGGCLWSPGP